MYICCGMHRYCCISYTYVEGEGQKLLYLCIIKSLNNNIDEHRVGDYLTRSDEHEVWGWDAFS